MLRASCKLPRPERCSSLLHLLFPKKAVVTVVIVGPRPTFPSPALDSDESSQDYKNHSTTVASVRNSIDTDAML